MFGVEAQLMKRLLAARALCVAACFGIFSVLAGTADAAGTADVEGAAAVQKIVQAKGTVRIIARLATPPGVQALTGSALATAQRSLAATMRAAGVTTVRPLGR